MARLIDADALDVHSLPMDMGGCLLIDDVTEMIANAPTIDTVTKCMDCCECVDVDGTPYCTFWNRNTEADWYCCKGWC